jgi:hypothetical protein
MTDKYSDEELNEVLKELMGDDLFTDKELGLNENDYLDKNGHYKEDSGHKYFNDRNYLTFKKFYSNMKPTKEDFYTLNHYYRLHSIYKSYMSNYLTKDYDYSFVESPVLRYLLFDESYNNDNIRNDHYFSLLDIEIREIMKNLIMLLKTSEDYDLINDIVEKIEQIKKTDYIFTEKEKKETIIPLLIYTKDS